MDVVQAEARNMAENDQLIVANLIDTCVDAFSAAQHLLVEVRKGCRPGWSAAAGSTAS